MKKFTKISLIVVAVLAVLGIMFCGIAFLIGGGSGVWKNGELVYGNWHVGSHGIYWRSDDTDWYDDISDIRGSQETPQTQENQGNQETPQTQENPEIASTELASLPQVNATRQDIALADIKNIKLDIDAAELQVKAVPNTETVAVELLRGKEEYYSCFLDGTTLTVSYDTGSHHFNNSPRIAVAIPQGASFDTVTIHTEAMAGEISLDTISCANMEINVGAGTFEAERLTVTEQLDVVIGAGDAEIEGGEFRNVKLDCGMGKLTFEGKVTGDITGHCGMGELELELYGRETDYNYELSCGLGRIEINDAIYSNLSGTKKTENAGAIGTMKLDCGMGSIEVDFE